MRLLRRLLLAVVVVALLYVGWRFPTENSETVRVHYLVGSFEAVPVWVVICVSFLLGALLATLGSSLKVARIGLERRRYRKAAKDLESEVHQLRNLPLSAEADLASDSAGDSDALPGLERGS